jgi:hypothetical protein
VGISLEFFRDNWIAILKDIEGYLSTVFRNAVINSANFVSELWKWSKTTMTGPILFDFKPLGDGFRSEVKQWPKFMKSELMTDNDEMKRLAARIFDRQQAAKGARIPAADAVDKASDAMKGETKRASDSRFGAVSAQSQEAYAALSRVTNAQAGPTLADKQLKEQQATNKKLDKIADNTKNNGLTIFKF